MNDFCEIQLSRGYVTIVDAADYEWLSQWKWFSHVDKDRVYATRSTGPRKDRRKIGMHRLILEDIIDRPLVRGEIADHADNNPLNNRRSNLRIATKQGNRANSKLEKTNTSGFRGVTFHKGCRKWEAKLRVSGRKIYLGLYDKPEDAYAAYCIAAVRYFGEFARLS